MAQQCSSLRISMRNSKSGSCRPGKYNMFSFLYVPKFLCATPNRSRVALIHIYYPLYFPIFQHLRILYVLFKVGVVSPWYTPISPFIFLHIQILYAQLQTSDVLPLHSCGFTLICEYIWLYLRVFVITSVVIERICNYSVVIRRICNHICGN